MGHERGFSRSRGASSARIEYIESTNLRYENRPDGEVIHKKYQTWVKNLGEEIKIAASQATAVAPPAAPK